MMMTRERITFEEVVIYAKQKFPAREGKTRTKDRTQTYIRCPFSMRQCMVLYEGERRPYGNTYETTWISSIVKAKFRKFLLAIYQNMRNSPASLSVRKVGRE
jgi:hypothetical protein